jgi:hypothetical protein
MALEPIAAPWAAPAQLFVGGGEEIAWLYLIHELSHLHIRNQIGNYKVSRLPFWFTEGLATYVSDGGGAHTVPERQAIDCIKSGRIFSQIADLRISVVGVPVYIGAPATRRVAKQAAGIFFV